MPYGESFTSVALLVIGGPKDGVRAAFGEPTASRGDDWGIYEVDGRFVHFEYDDEAIVWTVTLLAERAFRFSVGAIPALH